MPNHSHIYMHEAETYELLVSKQPTLDGCVNEIRPFAGLDIVDLGAGTGRLSAALAPQAKSLVALDASQSMLDVTARKLTQAGLTRWTTAVADHRSLPLPDDSADLIVAGWTICYLASRNVPDWERNVRDIIREMKRVLRSDGTAIIFETLGTGTKTPRAPDFLESYYRLLTDVYGFSHKSIRLDYEFDDIRQAERLAAFFFGDELRAQVRKNGWTKLPECAGVWWLQQEKRPPAKEGRLSVSL